MKHEFFWMALWVAAAMVSPASAASCDSLAGTTLPHTTITLAQSVAAGSFAPPGVAGDALQIFKSVPAFCRVAAVLKPSADSDIRMEVWMPAAGWNGRYQGQGNGGFAGSIEYSPMALAVTQGYASASTDTGHPATGVVDAKWALGHPEKTADFGWRAIHEMTVTAKALTAAFYGQAPHHSYFASCSNGGRQALMEAQRFPEDYDGIIAGAPANYWTHLLSNAAADVLVLQSDAASYIPMSKLPALSDAVKAACDAQDGVRDGIVSNPPDCHFDPGTMLCTSGDSDRCLTSAQVTALKKLYAGPKNSRGELIFPGFEPGGEDGPGGWGLWITGPHPGGSLLYAFSTQYFSNMVYANAAWDWRTFNIDSGVAAADRLDAKLLNATNPDLSGFRNRGGKLILYHGWSDAAIAPRNTVNYYNAVLAAMGRANADTFVRLYMAPGMQHCGGGPGPSSFGQFGHLWTAGDARHDMTTAMEQWVEKGIAPAEIIAEKRGNPANPSSAVLMTRPLCPYPMQARYKGSSDVNDAASFVCAAAGK